MDPYANEDYQDNLSALTNRVQAKDHLINFRQSGLVGGDVGLEVVNLFLDHFNLKRWKKNIIQGAQGDTS